MKAFELACAFLLAVTLGMGVAIVFWQAYFIVFN